MKKSFEFVNIEVAKAAAADATNFGLTALFEVVEDKPMVHFESTANIGESAPVSPTYEDFKCFTQHCMSEMEYRLKWMKEDLTYATQRFHEHMEGHLPPIKDVGKMQAAINTLGMGDSYQVQKASVYIQY